MRARWWTRAMRRVNILVSRVEFPVGENGKTAEERWKNSLGGWIMAPRHTRDNPQGGTSGMPSRNYLPQVGVGVSLR